MLETTKPLNEEKWFKEYSAGIIYRTMGSNIEEVENANQVRATIAEIKKDIKSNKTMAADKNDPNHVSNTISTNCKNKMTGIMYDIEKGSPSEATLFRVMPADDTNKMYFDSKEEYERWKEQKMRG